VQRIPAEEKSRTQRVGEASTWAWGKAREEKKSREEKKRGEATPKEGKKQPKPACSQTGKTQELQMKRGHRVSSQRGGKKKRKR